MRYFFDSRSGQFVHKDQHGLELDDLSEVLAVGEAIAGDLAAARMRSVTVAISDATGRRLRTIRSGDVPAARRLPRTETFPRSQARLSAPRETTPDMRLRK